MKKLYLVSFFISFFATAQEVNIFKIIGEKTSIPLGGTETRVKASTVKTEAKYDGKYCYFYKYSFLEDSTDGVDVLDIGPNENVVIESFWKKASSKEMCPDESGYISFSSIPYDRITVYLEFLLEEKKMAKENTFSYQYNKGVSAFKAKYGYSRTLKDVVGMAVVGRIVDTVYFYYKDGTRFSMTLNVGGVDDDGNIVVGLN